MVAPIYTSTFIGRISPQSVSIGRVLCFRRLLVESEHEAFLLVRLLADSQHEECLSVFVALWLRSLVES